jgi:hypothetical protein
MPNVRSSHISAVDYSVPDRTLTVSFRDSSVYAYAGVPAPTYQSFLAAPSKGKFFKARIQGKFKTKVLKKAKPAPRNPS